MQDDDEPRRGGFEHAAEEQSAILPSSNFEVKLPKASGDNPWAVATRRHNEALVEAKRQFGGEVFTRAPFDLIDASGSFIEVKVARYRYQHAAHQWRVCLTSAEIRFARVKPVLLYVVWGNNVSLIPMSLWMDQLSKRALQRNRYQENDKWSLVMDIPLEDLNRYLIRGIPSEQKALLGSTEDLGSPVRWHRPISRRTRIPRRALLSPASDDQAHE